MRTGEARERGVATGQRARPGAFVCPGLVVAAFAVLGCGSGPTTVAVSGRVEFDGGALDDGMIVFRAPTGPVLAVSGAIKDGRYALRMPPGPKLVEILASREVGAMDPLMKVRQRQRYIPERYNDRTELRADVRARGANTFDFVLEK